METVQDAEYRRLKAMWTVKCGVVPGHEMVELGKHWYYSDADFEEDRKNLDQSSKTIFMRMAEEAQAYWYQRNDPAHFNWANLEFMWV